MNINFKYLKDVATTLHTMHLEDENAYNEGRFVHSVEFRPVDSSVQVHVQYPMFNELLQRYPGSHIRADCYDDVDPFVHLSASFGGIDFVAIMHKPDLIRCLSDRGVHVREDACIKSLYAAYDRIVFGGERTQHIESGV